jgi:hypothetical protein
LNEENVVDYYYQEQQENFLHAIMEQQQMELEKLIQIADNLKNDIIKLHDQEKELIQRLNILKTSQTSLLTNIYSFVSNKNVLFFGMNKYDSIKFFIFSYFYFSFWFSHRFLYNSYNK